MVEISCKNINVTNWLSFHVKYTKVNMFGDVIFNHFVA